MSGILTSLVSGFAYRIGIEIAEKSLPTIKKHVKNTVRQTVEAIEYTSETIVEIIDDGWLKDYYAGGLSAQFSKSNTENA